ncbi:MAG: histidine kinase [Coriobacteriaceae bacterium]|nr:histidine kinase [Coriobacteriaceae bacterium]
MDRHRETLEFSNLALHFAAVLQDIFSAFTPDEILGRTVQNTRDFLDSETATISLREKGQYKIVAIAHRDHDYHELLPYTNTAVPDYSLTSSIARTGRPAIWKFDGKGSRADWLISPYYLGVPIFGEHDEVVGTIVMDFNYGEGLDAQNIFLAEVIAKSFWGAYHNSLKHIHMLSRAQIIEQERIAQSLHDTVAQNIFSASMKVDKIAEDASCGRGIKRDLFELKTMLSQLKNNLRNIVYDSPAKNTVLDLQSMIENELDLHRQQSDIRIDGYLESTEGLSAQVTRVLHIAVKETLANIRKHSQAQAATIMFSLRNDLAYLSIQDDGIGMAGETTTDTQQGFHFGLANLRRLVKEVDGNLTIESSGEGEGAHGTSIYIRIPLSTKE